MNNRLNLKNTQQKSRINYDLDNEKVIKKIVVEHLKKSPLISHLEVSNKAHDLRGSDIELVSKELFGDDILHHIDLKTAANYRKIKGEPGLPTFAFELAFLNKNREMKPGWLFGEQYDLPDYYLLSWIWVKTSEKTKYSVQLSEKDISQIELLLVGKKDIHDYLRDEFNIKNFEKVEKLIKNFNGHLNRIINSPEGKDEYKMKIARNIKGDLISAQLSLSSPKEYGEKNKISLPKLYYSHFLAEQPYNIIIAKTKLIELCKNRNGFHEIIEF
ncbi:hypothetical protein OZX68_03425 [Streptococcaceae bacterium ESL0729]|nr:hypothetical protein OZX68_03425 [Streptococcaceae bacterium ESL0729]